MLDDACVRVCVCVKSYEGAFTGGVVAMYNSHEYELFSVSKSIGRPPCSNRTVTVSASVASQNVSKALGSRMQSTMRLHAVSSGKLLSAAADVADVAPALLLLLLLLLLPSLSVRNT